MVGEKYFWNLRDDAKEKLNDTDFKLYRRLSESLIDIIDHTCESSYNNWLGVDKFVEVLADYKIQDANGFKLKVYSRNYNSQHRNNIHAKIIVLSDNIDYRTFDVYKDKRTKYVVLTDDFINENSLNELKIKLVSIFNDCYDYWHRKS